MRIIFMLTTLMLSTAAFSSEFSAEEILGTYVSHDRRAEVRIYKEIIRERTLFEPEVYEYYADIAFDGGPCLEMYGGDRKVVSRKNRFRYNGSWRPKAEYLSVGFGEDNDYDGSTYIQDASFTATKEKKNGKSMIRMSLDFALGHNPDYSDGEDGGVSAFNRCSKRTVSSWNRFNKRR